MTESEHASERRKAEIVRRLRAGESGAQIARDLGVTRQYVSLLNKRLQREGHEAVLSSGPRGRPRHRPLTDAEVASLRKHIESRRPNAPGAATSATSSEVIAWFKQKHGRPLSVHELRKFCGDHGLRLARPSDDAADAPAVSAPEAEEHAPAQAAKIEQAPRKRRGTSLAKMSPDELAAMARSNAEVAQRIQAARTETAPVPAPAATRPMRLPPKLGRNDPCPFDPGKKFKRCCGATGATRCLRAAGA